jgi:hypothetical protein
MLVSAEVIYATANIHLPRNMYETFDVGKRSYSHYITVTNPNYNYNEFQIL